MSGNPSRSEPKREHGHGAHGWLMIACCVPMLVIAVALVVTGVAGPGFIVAAVGCTLMMALMMRGMSGGDGDEERRRDAGNHR